jgi:hypothetical protein
MIRGLDAWGPFADGLDPAEYRARCRCLRAVAHLTTGPRGEALADRLRQAETDTAALPLALDALNRLAGLDRRHVLTSYAVLNRPHD